MLHLVIVFLHVASAMGIVVALAIEGVMLRQLRAAASASDASTALGLARLVQRVGTPSVLAALVTGMYLATVYWRWQGAWMGFGFLTLIAIAIVGALMTGRRLVPLQRDGGPVRAFDVVALRRGLATSFAIRTSLFAGILFLMTVKPQAKLFALVVVVVAAILGVAVARLGFPGAAAAPNDSLGRVA